MATGYRDSYTYHKASDFDRFTKATSRVSADIPQLTRDKDEIRILLIGKTGAGKSMTGNTILGRETFKVKASSQSVTQKLQYDHVIIEGKKLVVVDTPGYFDTQLSEDALKREIENCVGITSPGLHAFILVTEIGRMTQESLDVISKCRGQFGDHMENYLIVLFTKTDSLEREKTTIEDFLAELDENNDFKKLLRKAHNRYIAFNNIASREIKQKQVKALKNKIEQLIEENNGKIFTNQMYIEAEEAFQRKIRRELREKELQKQREFEKQIEPLLKNMKCLKAQIEEKNRAFETLRTEMERSNALTIKNLEEKFEKQLELERNKSNINADERMNQIASLLQEKTEDNDSLREDVANLKREISSLQSEMKKKDDEKAEMERINQEEKRQMELEKDKKIEEMRTQHRRELEKKSKFCKIL